MPIESATTGPAPTAPDVYAPGHLGEPTQIIDPELVDAVLQDTGAREKRLRLLPERRRMRMKARWRKRGSKYEFERGDHPRTAQGYALDVRVIEGGWVGNGTGS